LVSNFNREISGEEVNSYLYNLHDMEIIFNKNESGYSKDIDGQVFLFII
jgi:hypothetical protein